MQKIRELLKTKPLLLNKAVHIGEPLQLYFGIKGKRWDGMGFYNEHWVSPAETERPAGLSKVENGCYW